MQICRRDTIKQHVGQQWAHHATYTKDNFEFERRIALNRALRIVDMRRKSNMFTSNAEIQQRRKGTTLERCIRSSCPRLRHRAGCGHADRTIRPLAAPGLPIPARGTSNQAPGTDHRAQRSHHRQGARGHCHEAARTCAAYRLDDWRSRLTSSVGIAGSGGAAWLSAVSAAVSALSIALIVCLTPRSNRSMTSWFRIALGAPAGPRQ